MRKTAILGAGAGLYFGLPYLAWQWANLGVLRRGSGGRAEVGLTFDDGPDPRGTPRVLDALDAAGAKATFFLLGEQALAHPRLAREIARRGHEIGCHGFRHRHAYLRAPWEIAPDIRQGVAAIERTTGLRPRLFRPAHGAYTLATPRALRAAGLIPVHWTVEAHDWSAGFTPERVRRRILDAVEPGAILVLHDGGPGAENAARALPDLLAALADRGYAVVPAGALAGPQTGDLRDAALRLWQGAEGLFERAIALDDFTRGHALEVLRLARTRYEGPPLTLPDGSAFGPGEAAGEIHLHSARMQAAVRDHPVAALRRARRSMRTLAEAAREHPKYRDLRLFYGIHLRPDVFTSLGFGVAEFPDKRPYLAAYMRFLRALHGAPPLPAGCQPMLLWIDRATLLERYAGSPRSGG